MAENKAFKNRLRAAFGSSPGMYARAAVALGYSMRTLHDVAGGYKRLYSPMDTKLREIENGSAPSASPEHLERLARSVRNAVTSAARHGVTAPELRKALRDLENEI